MRHLSTRGAIGLVVALLALPAVAGAEPPFSTILISRPPGFGPLAPGIVGANDLSFNAVSDDGCRTAFISESDGLSSEDDDSVQNAYVRDDCANTTTLASRATGAAGTGANGTAFVARISGDGTRVAFRSRATNLSSADGDIANDIYVRDLSSDTTTLVSRASGVDGVKQNGSGCDAPTLSDDGTKVAFSCGATNLDPDDGDTAQDVYLRDLTTSTTALVSRANTASGVKGNGSSRTPVISGDGNRVAFESSSTNVVTGDTDSTVDIVVRDLPTATNTLASRLTGVSGTKSTSVSITPDLNQDGTKVAFRSFGLGDGSGQVYVRDLTGSTTSLVSRATGSGGATADHASQRPSIDDAGTKVAFDTVATNLSAADTNGTDDVYVRDIAGNSTTLVSSTFGTVGDATSIIPAISGNGLHVSFQTDADNLSAQDSNDFSSILRRTLSGSSPGLVSRPTGTGGFGGDGTADANLSCCTAQVSVDGRFVTFASQTDTLSADDDNRFLNVFVRDTRTGATTLVSRATGATGATADGSSGVQAISADGRRVAFTSSSTNLIAGGDTNGAQRDLFVRDLVTDETVLVSRADGADGAQAVFGVFTAALDDDGSRVAFSSQSSNLVPGASGSQVYVRDLETNQTLLASRADGPQGVAAAGGGIEIDTDISGDGRIVAFASEDVALGADGVRSQVFVRDLAAGTTEMVSRASGPAGTRGDQRSAQPVLDGDGSRVAFASRSSNLALDDPDTTDDVVLRDRATSQTVLVSRASGAAGTKADGGGGSPTISADGTRVLFLSTSANLEAGVTGQQAYLRDLASATTTLAVRADGAAGVPADPTSAQIAPGGSCVIFESVRRNLAPGYTGTHRQVYLRALDAECPDITAPDTTIATGPSGTVTDAVASFSFAASESGASFTCRLDGDAFAACSSPFTSPALAPGAHTFEVRAADRFGNVDASPAARAFTVASAQSGGPPGGSPPPPTASPTPRAGRLRFTGRSTLRIARAGTLKMPVSCPAATSGCRGTMRLRAKLRTKAGGRSRTVTIATRTFSVKAGRSTTLLLRLSKSTRATVLRGSRRRATLELAPRGVSGTRRTSVTLVPPRGRAAALRPRWPAMRGSLP